jgi:hypothetical protein
VFIKFKVRYTFSSTRKSHICNFFMKEISVLQSPHRPDDEGRKDLWNVGELIPVYTALQSRRQPSSYSPP